MRPAPHLAVAPAIRPAAQPHRVKLAGLRKLHDFRDNQLGKRVFSIAVELQYVANPIEGCAHRFEKLGVSVEF